MSTPDPDTYDVNDYDSGSTLPGLPALDLVRESLATDTGAVKAFYDGEYWQHVDPSQVSSVESQGNKVRTVYVTRT